MSSLMESWNKNWYGFWRLSSDEAGDYPLLSDLIGTACELPDLERIIGYLDAAPVVVCSQDGTGQCPICKEWIGNPSCYRSDGQWLWPQDLGHYVVKHDVGLPNTLIRHIREHSYIPPRELSVPPEQLPWP